MQNKSSSIYMVSDQYMNEKNRNKITVVIAQAQAAFETSEYGRLIKIIEELLEQGVRDIEQEISLRCMLNEALCEMSRYKEAAEALFYYDQDPIALSESHQARLSLRTGVTYNSLGQYPQAI